jgi:hypothetical protein
MDFSLLPWINHSIPRRKPTNAFKQAGIFGGIFSTFRPFLPGKGTDEKKMLVPMRWLFGCSGPSNLFPSGSMIVSGLKFFCLIANFAGDFHMLASNK